MQASIHRVLLPMLAALTCVAVQAEPVLADKDLNVPNLVEALAPPAPAPAAASDSDTVGGEVVLRSIRVTRDRPSAKVVEQGAGQPANKPSAALLVTFVTNSAELTGRARTSIDVVTRVLQDDRLASFTFGVGGHADPRGNPDKNLKLCKRAMFPVLASDLGMCLPPSGGDQLAAGPRFQGSSAS